MTQLKFYEQLRTGDQFIAKGKDNHKVIRCQFIGINLVALQESRCDYIMIKNLSTGEIQNVGAVWFVEHRITVTR